MKKISIVISAMLLLLFTVGCVHAEQSGEETTNASLQAETQQPSNQVDETEESVLNSVVSQQTMTAVSVPALTEEVYSEDTVIFTYTYPSMNLMLQDAEVADKIILDFLNRVDTTASIAQELQDNAKRVYNSSEDWIPYMLRVLYEPTRIDAGVLSLFGSISTYSGGMHPDHTNISASYDLLTGDVLTLGSIMHKDAQTQTFGELVTEILEERKDKLYLYGDFSDYVEKRFQTDESQDEDFYFTSTGLCFYFSPYEIAPYSSGTITVEIPYEKLIGVIHDSFFPPEHMPTDGVIEITPYIDANMEEVGQIGEAILTPGGQMYLLTATNSVDNVFLTLSSNDPQIHKYMFFAAAELAPGSGIMIEATEAEISNLIITYENSAGTQTISQIS